MTAPDFVSLYRTAVAALFDSRKRLKSLNELNTTTEIVDTLDDGPLLGTNADITKADLVAALAAASDLETHLTDFTVNPNVPTATNAALQKLL